MSWLGGGGSVLGNVDLLSIAARTRVPGIGISARSRALTNQFLNQTSGGANAMFSAGVAEGPAQLQQQILALRAKLPQRNFADNLLFSDPDRGSKVDTKA
jgi:hypothetical protein